MNSCFYGGGFIIKLLCDKIQIRGRSAAFPDYESNLIVLLNFEDENELNAYKGYEFADMVQVLHAQLKSDCSIIISHPGNVADIRKMYLEMMRVQPFNKAGNVWDCRNQACGNGSSSDGMAGETTLNSILELKDALTKNNMDRAASVIEMMWNESREKETEIFSNFFESAYGLLMNDMLDRGYRSKDVFGEELSVENIIQKDVPIGQKKEVLIKRYGQRFEYEQRRAGSKSYKVASAAEYYIKEHYADSGLSIAEISRELFVNQTYLRKMFKEEKNMTLSEYIVKYRMEKAKDLILHTDEKLAVIAERVGYADVSYFSNCFKKYYGISPRSIVS